MKRNHETNPSSTRLRSIVPAMGAVLALWFSFSLTAEGVGISTVGSLPATSDNGRGGFASPRLDPSFFVRGPKEFFDNLLSNGEAVLDESGTGLSVDLVERETGWIRREYRGDVYIELAKRHLVTGEVQVGVLAGVRSAMGFVTSVDGLEDEGRILRSGLALTIPVSQLSPRGVLDSRLGIETLQFGRARGMFSMQEGDDTVKVFQDQ